MKHIIALILTLCLLVAGLSLAEATPEPVPGKLILTTCYRNYAWGTVFSFAAIDENGVAWVYNTNDDSDLPQNSVELAEYLQTSGKLTAVCRLTSDQLFTLKSLIACVEDQEVVISQLACDAGIQEICAMRNDGKGGTECVVLGIAGDEMFENTDPAAQTLYSLMQQLFSGDIDCIHDPDLSPKGFQSVSLMEFTGYADVDLTGCTVTAYKVDCEEGRIEIEVPENILEMLDLTVTGKVNGLSVTGETVIYIFTDANEDIVAAFEFYDGLLVMYDGMYSVA